MIFVAYLIFQANTIHFEESIGCMGKVKNQEILLVPQYADHVIIVKNTEVSRLPLYKRLRDPQEVAGDKDFIYISTLTKLWRIDKRKPLPRLLWDNKIPFKFSLTPKNTIILWDREWLKEITRTGELIKKSPVKIYPLEFKVKGDSLLYLFSNTFFIEKEKILFSLENDNLKAISLAQGKIFLFLKDMERGEKLENFWLLFFPELADAEVVGERVYLLKDSRTLLILPLVDS